MDYISLLKDNFGEETDKLIDEKIKEYNGLLNKETAAKLIAKEKNLIKEKTIKINEMASNSNNIHIEAVISRMNPINKYPSGKKMRVLRIKDETGEAELKLWNEDAEKPFHLGDKIEIRDAYLKNNQLSLGYKGTVTISQKANFVKLSELKEGVQNTVATVKVARPDLLLLEDGIEMEAVVENPNLLQHFKEGQRIALEGAWFSNGKLIIKNSTRLLLKKNLKIIKGKLERMEHDDEKTRLYISGKEYEIENQKMIRFLNIKNLNEDINPSTILELKKKSVEGENVEIHMKGGKIAGVLLG
ncbi:hypothetical protein KAW38_01520 [Candidatus Micrarchaeota archaeon]|nr:hypothetical protein [Candidatus Micrarchaeota archaeon]